MKNPQPDALKKRINRSPYLMGFFVKIYFVDPSKCDVAIKVFAFFFKRIPKISV